MRHLQIDRRPLSAVQCAVQAHALKWWVHRDGVMEPGHKLYAPIKEHAQVAIRKKDSSPFFVFVGAKSLTAQILGKHYTPAVRAGGWWDDGGYQRNIESIYPEVDTSQQPSIETIRAWIQLPSEKPIVLHYDRLIMPTKLSSGKCAYMLITSQRSILLPVD